MARRTISRLQKREEYDAAEEAGLLDEEEVDEESSSEEEGSGDDDKPAKAKKKPAKRKSRAKEPVEVRLKLFWGVFNQSLKRVALYEFTQKKQAEQKAAELSGTGKSPHFVRKEKIPVGETET
jgi:hypothetical protein